MRSKTRIVIGSIVLALGVLLLLENLLHIEIWGYLWPSFSIGIGVWILTRPRRFGGRSFTQLYAPGETTGAEESGAAARYCWRPEPAVGGAGSYDLQDHPPRPGRFLLRRRGPTQSCPAG